MVGRPPRRKKWFKMLSSSIFVHIYWVRWNANLFFLWIFVNLFYLPPLKSDADDEEYAEKIGFKSIWWHMYNLVAFNNFAFKVWSRKSNYRLWPIYNLWEKQCLLNSIQSSFHLMSPWCCGWQFGLLTATILISKVFKLVGFAS